MLFCLAVTEARAAVTELPAAPAILFDGAAWDLFRAAYDALVDPEG